MRKINTSDIFKTMRLLKTAGVKEELLPMIKNYADQLRRASQNAENADTDNTALVESVGIFAILSVMEVLATANCESSVYEILAGIFGNTADEVANMDLDELALNLEIMAAENDLKKFFTTVFNLITTKP